MLLVWDLVFIVSGASRARRVFVSIPLKWNTRQEIASGPLAILSARCRISGDAPPCAAPVPAADDDNGDVVSATTAAAAAGGREGEPTAAVTV